MEDRQVGGVVLIGTEHLARADNAHRRLLFEQGVNLHRAGGGAHALAIADRIEPQGVLQGAGGMVGAQVQCVEVEPLGLGLRALRDLPAHGGEDVADVVDEGCDRVRSALR